MLNAKIVFGGTATLVFVLLIAGTVRYAAWLVIYAAGFLYGAVILASLVKKPNLARGILGVVLIGIANWLALFIAGYLNFGFAYAISPALWIISLSILEAVLIVLVVKLAWSIQFDFGGGVTSSSIHTPSCVDLHNIAFTVRASLCAMANCRLNVHFFTVVLWI